MFDGRTLKKSGIKDTAKGGLAIFWEPFYRDSLRAKTLKMLITSLHEDIWVSQ